MRFAAVIRWLHIYVSMLAFTIVLFFSLTGLTLSHADWFFDLLYLKRRRTPGLILAVVGTVVVIGIFRFWVP